ncbi:site-specific integrase [Pseudoxanthomonas jiangsuensis]|uniref:site-specific integrase n=1 Tax=Pseudoxanthomonas jiangsuensis TaxID=619688 RepID=UPI00139126E9|nr:site-specific integrase [Pseudoxanthomonas jiangsuensis]
MVEMMDALVDGRGNMSAATFRLRKAAVVHCLHLLISSSPDRYRGPGFHEAMERLGATSSAGCRKRGSNTSSKKSRTISKGDLRKIEARLLRLASHSRIAGATLAAITLLNIFGMRPSELIGLRTASLPDGSIELNIRCSKITNGRGLGEFRKVRAVGLTDNEKALILSWPVYLASTAGQDEAKFLRNLKACLRRAAETALGARPSYPSFYTFRHQAIADMKSVGRNPEQIAAAMGHGSSRTATTHYARKSTGRGSTRLSPDPALVARVRATATTYSSSLQGNKRTGPTTA